MEIIDVALVSSYFLVVWLRTSAFAEYLNLLGLGRFFRIDEYHKLSSEGYVGTYTDFLAEYYRALFIVRLLICPVCVSFWMGVISLTFLEFKDACLLPPLTLLLYTVFNKML
jgi:hypothetical protein